jgi:hypothetical protein
MLYEYAMVALVLSTNVGTLLLLQTIQGSHIESYDVHLGLHSIGSQVVSHSSSGVSGHMNLPQHRLHLGISSAHIKFISKA